ncbi:MAG: Re/Si-specific NAD(P)(+) transhydrogenase subunit alpha [Cardiobacteriaceae bacterium]|nr:Re/Si-specific NAD(P)(+) transhydrogenase subunit alpha [Cardiobacteriaceae bacterium]
MQIGIPKETINGEQRIAATPKTVKELQKLGFEVLVQSGAGMGSQISDGDYRDAGAKIVNEDAIYDCGAIYKVNPPSDDELKKIKDGTVLVGFIYPRTDKVLLDKLAARKITVLAMDMVPRISRAQSLDALSSMANISGYRAVVEAASELTRSFGGQITAAGKVQPAKVLVIGAGVAGLAAIGAAKSLGAIVRAFDTREEVAEQITSMGGEFLRLDFEEKSDGGVNTGYAKQMSKEYIEAEMNLFAEQAKEVDVIITTAAIPGKESPKLISKEMVSSMKRGSVIVDLAAAGGGNCELTVVGKKAITTNGVTILGYTDLANRLPGQASQLYATNLVNLTKLLSPKKDGNIEINFEDAVIRNMTVVNDGELSFPPPEISVSAAPKAEEKTAEGAQEGEAEIEVDTPKNPCVFKWGYKAALLLVGILLVGAAPEAFLNHLMVFVLSIVIGYYVIWNVSASLHTPLMSVTNAISGIIIVGAMAQLGGGSCFASILAFIAVLLVSINIFGGFAVTRRMLAMFRKDEA